MLANANGGAPVANPVAPHFKREFSQYRSAYPGMALPIAILGIPFDNVTLVEAVHRIQTMIASRKPHYVVTANVDFLVQAANDPELRDIFLDADLVLCDGTPLVWVSRWLGNPLPERVAGADLVPELIRVAASRKQRLFFLGATKEANNEAVARVLRQFPDLIIAGQYSPPFQPLDKMDHAEIGRRIRLARPDLLFVAFGCPKAEKWMAMNYRSLGVPVAIGIGGTLDFIAGRVQRAPHWIQRCGAEWLFRLCQEPRRLFRRYARDLWQFSWELLKQLVNNRFSRFRCPEPASELCILSSSHPASPDWKFIKLPRRFDAEFVRGSEQLRSCSKNINFALEMTDVRFMDSTGVALLIRLRRELRANGKRLVLVSPSRAAQLTLDVMRILDFFLASDGDVTSGAPGQSAAAAHNCTYSIAPILEEGLP